MDGALRMVGNAQIGFRPVDPVAYEAYMTRQKAIKEKYAPMFAALGPAPSYRRGATEEEMVAYNEREEPIRARYEAELKVLNEEA